MVDEMHSSRSRARRTGRRRVIAMNAVTGSKVNSCLPPNEPPMGTLITRTWL